MSGYKIIDFKGTTIPPSTGTAVAIPGVLAAIKSADKPMVCTNVVLNVSGTATAYKPFFAYVAASGTSYIINVCDTVSSSAGVTGRIITVDKDSKVTFTDTNYKAV